MAQDTELRQPAEIVLGRCLVFEEAEVPEVLADQLFPGTTEELGDIGVRVDYRMVFRLEKNQAVASGFKKPAIALFRAHHFALKTKALSDVVDAEENALRRAIGVIKPAGVQEHGAGANALQMVSHFEIVERGISWEDLLEQLAQRRNVPLAIAEFVDEAALRFGGSGAEGLVKGGVGRVNTQIGVEDKDWIPGGADERLGVLAGLGNLLGIAFERIDIEEDKDRAVDFVLEIEVWPDPQGIPVALFVPHLALAFDGLVDHGCHIIFEVVELQIMTNAPDGPANVAGEKIENGF